MGARSKTGVTLALVVSALILGGCAARTARTIEVRQPHDAEMGCAQLDSEISAMRRLMQAYAADGAQQSERNQMAVLGALVNPMILINADPGDAATKELLAYGQRIDHLSSLKTAKECPND